MDKLRQELSSLHIEKALDIATRDGAFAKEMYAGFGSCKDIYDKDIDACKGVYFLDTGISYTACHFHVHGIWQHI